MRITPSHSFIVSACLLAAAWSATASTVPGHPGVDRLPACGADNLDAMCRMSLPNGDFSGYDGDDFYHGEFRWGSLNPQTHSITRHIVPWIYEPHGDASFLRNKATTRLTLPHAGDRIVQWVDLPTHTNDTDVMYTLHVHMRGEKGEAGAGVGLFLYEDDSSILKSVTRSTAHPGTGHPNQELIGSLLVPAGTTGGRLGIAVGIPKAGSGYLVIDDVALIRSQPGDASAMWKAL